jgi:hypothetical protein
VGPPGSEGVAAALGLEAWSAADHTRLFVLGLPPYASIHLGPEGKLGGEGADRVAGVWRTLGLTPPADVDHLGAILGLYSELGEATGSARIRATRDRLDHVRATVLWEHLWPWVPAYLDALRGSDGAAAPWAELLLRALTRETGATPGAPLLPLALRAAPAGITAGDTVGDLLDALTAPIRVGMVLTHDDLVHAGHDLGVGLRRGERRFVLRTMLEQDGPATLSWLQGHALRWADIHRRRPPVPADPAPWWAGRATRTATVLGSLAGERTPRSSFGER